MIANRLLQRFFLLVLIAAWWSAGNALAQTTAFTYQGKLTEGASPANGSYQMQFKLFDSSAGVGQVGSTIADVPVTASEGIFSVLLDFGLNALSGANRWLEIAVRHNAGESYTSLSPREQIASAPYAVRTLSAASADNALSLGGIAASQYLQTTGSGANLTNLNAGNITAGILSNARLGQLPTANIADAAVTGQKIAGGQVVKSVNALKDDVTLAGGANVSITTAGNTLTIAASGGGAGGAILNQTTLQSPANFNIDGNGFIGGNVGVGTQTPVSRLNVAGIGYGVMHSTPSVSLTSYIDINSQAGWFGTKTNHPLYLFTNNAVQPQVVVSADGRVGIGTASPSARLAVSGAGAYNAVGAARIDLSNTVAGAGFLQNVTDAGLWQIATTAGATRMVIDSAGNVGIGTTTPGSQLTVNGSGTNGFALGVNGHAGQSVSSGGFVKAMVYVDPFLPADQYVVRCYNSQNGMATGNCGFSVIRGTPGNYSVDFGFPINNRFFSIMLSGNPVTTANTFPSDADNNVVVLSIWDTIQSKYVDNRFYLIVF